MTALTLELDGVDAGPWQCRSRSDRAVNALADRHYSRRHPGVGRVGSNGRALVFVTHDEQATWVTTWPAYPLDGLDSWRCSMFRNESPQLSSGLIVAAMALTRLLWPDPPPDGWSTYVDTAKVDSRNPGYCFKRAGWHRDRAYVPDRRRRNLIRLRAAA